MSEILSTAVFSGPMSSYAFTGYEGWPVLFSYTTYTSSSGPTWTSVNVKCYSGTTLLGNANVTNTETSVGGILFRLVQKETRDYNGNYTNTYVIIMESNPSFSFNGTGVLKVIVDNTQLVAQQNSVLVYNI